MFSRIFLRRISSVSLLCILAAALPGHIGARTITVENVVYEVTDEANHFAKVSANHTLANYQAPITIKAQVEDDINQGVFFTVNEIDINCFNGAPITGVTIEAAITTWGLYAFRDCPNLKQVTITGDCTRTGTYAFYGCPELTDVSLPASMQTIGAYTFYGCSKLANVNFAEMTSLEEIGGSSFSGCSLLTLKGDFPASLKYIKDSSFENCPRLGKVTIPSGTQIWSYAFRNSGITELDITADNIGLTSACFAYANLPATLTISPSIKSLPPNAFSYVTGVETLIVEDNPELLIDTRCFSGSSISEIQFQGSVGSIGESAFNSCKLTGLRLPPCNRIGNYAFANNPLTSIDWGTQTAPGPQLGNYLFTRCTELESVSIPGWVGTVPRSMFYECSKLSDLTIGDGVTDIDPYAFARTALRTVTLPATLTEIKNNVFESCGELVSVAFPSSLTKIGDAAFLKCTKLEIPD